MIDAESRPHQTLADRVKSLMWPHSGSEAVLEADRGLARMLTGQFWYCPAMSYRMDRLPDIWWDVRWHQVMDLDLYGRLLLAGERIVLLQRRVLPLSPAWFHHDSRQHGLPSPLPRRGRGVRRTGGFGAWATVARCRVCGSPSLHVADPLPNHLGVIAGSTPPKSGMGVPSARAARRGPRRDVPS